MRELKMSKTLSELETLLTEHTTLSADARAKLSAKLIKLVETNTLTNEEFVKLTTAVNKVLKTNGDELALEKAALKKLTDAATTANTEQQKLITSVNDLKSAAATDIQARKQKLDDIIADVLKDTDAIAALTLKAGTITQDIEAAKLKIGTLTTELADETVKVKANSDKLALAATEATKTTESVKAIKLEVTSAVESVKTVAAELTKTTEAAKTLKSELTKTKNAFAKSTQTLESEGKVVLDELADEAEKFKAFKNTTTKEMKRLLEQVKLDIDATELNTKALAAVDKILQDKLSKPLDVTKLTEQIVTEATKRLAALVPAAGTVVPAVVATPTPVDTAALTKTITDNVLAELAKNAPAAIDVDKLKDAIAEAIIKQIPDPQVVDVPQLMQDIVAEVLVELKDQAATAPVQAAQLDVMEIEKSVIESVLRRLADKDTSGLKVTPEVTKLQLEAVIQSVSDLDIVVKALPAIEVHQSDLDKVVQSVADLDKVVKAQPAQTSVITQKMFDDLTKEVHDLSGKIPAVHQAVASGSTQGVNVVTPEVSRHEFQLMTTKVDSIATALADLVKLVATGVTAQPGLVHNTGLSESDAIKELSVLSTLVTKLNSDLLALPALSSATDKLADILAKMDPMVLTASTSIARMVTNIEAVIASKTKAAVSGITSQGLVTKVDKAIQELDTHAMTNGLTGTPAYQQLAYELLMTKHSIGDPTVTTTAATVSAFNLLTTFPTRMSAISTTQTVADRLVEVLEDLSGLNDAITAVNSISEVSAAIVRKFQTEVIAIRNILASMTATNILDPNLAVALTAVASAQTKIDELYRLLELKTATDTSPTLASQVDSDVAVFMDQITSIDKIVSNNPNQAELDNAGRLWVYGVTLLNRMEYPQFSDALLMFVDWLDAQPEDSYWRTFKIKGMLTKQDPKFSNLFTILQKLAPHDTRVVLANTLPMHTLMGVISNARVSAFSTIFK